MCKKMILIKNAAKEYTPQLGKHLANDMTIF